MANQKNDSLEMPEFPEVSFDAPPLSEEELSALQLEDPDLIALVERLGSDAPDRPDKVMVPEDLENSGLSSGKLYGFLRLDSGYHVILGWEGHEPVPELGAQEIGALLAGPKEAVEAAALRDPETALPFLAGFPEEGGLSFLLFDASHPEGYPLRKEIYTLRQSLFSRNSGLIETDWLDEKCAVISGVGSVGSCVALQLARSGVGRFILVDTDCMEIHNVCRHQCGLNDVGRYKVDAIRERILRINPRAQVRVFRRRIQEADLDSCREWLSPRSTLFIGTCDNRVGNAYACDAAMAFGAPFIALGFMERAWAGEIFVYLPQRHDICYRCAFHRQIEEDIELERRNHLYIDDGRAAEAHIVPGLDVDIEFGVSILDKLALDILNLGNPDYVHRLLFKAGQFNYFCGTADRSEGEFWKKALPDPICFRPVRLDDSMRRCETCRSKA